MNRDFYSSLVYLRKKPLLGRLAYYLLKALGIEMPLSVRVGDDIELVHGGFGIVVHSQTVIGDRVKLYPGVTIGRADIYVPIEQSLFIRVEIEDDVILCPGSKVLCQQGVMKIGRGTVLGANAVLLKSTGEREIWAGIPARFIRHRDDRNNQWDASQDKK